MSDQSNTTTFVQHLSGLYMNTDFSDVVFIVENNKLPAHKCILAARSSYFRALLYGGLLESSQTEIELKVPLNAFKVVLQFIYAVPLEQMEYLTIFDTLGLAHQFCIAEMEAMITSQMISKLSPQNCINIYNAFDAYGPSLPGMKALKDVTEKFIDAHATAVLCDNEFKKLKQTLLCSMLERDSFYAAEMDIFKAVLGWCNHNHKIGDDMQAIMSLIRFPLMDLKELLTVVRESTVINPERLLDLIYDKAVGKNSICRGILRDGENVAVSRLGASVIENDYEQNEKELLNGNSSVYDDLSGYTSHEIGDNDGIVVELGSNYIINHLRILLWDRDDRSYSYFVEVSQNQTDWDKVVDYSNHFCRSWQRLHFASRTVRYIKLVGTNNTKNSRFHAVALEALYVRNGPTLVNGFISPTWNVATVDEGARVIEGEAGGGDDRNAMLRGSVALYTDSIGFTFHRIAQDKSIVVQLSQPVNIDSVSLLLWDVDKDREYSFYIVTSINKIDWQMAVDKRTEQLKSRQQFSFQSRPVVFIKIVGTHNSSYPVNDCFELHQFEARCQS